MSSVAYQMRLRPLWARVDTTKYALAILLDGNLTPQTSQSTSFEQENNPHIVLRHFKQMLGMATDDLTQSLK